MITTIFSIRRIAFACIRFDDNNLVAGGARQILVPRAGRHPHHHRIYGRRERFPCSGCSYPYAAPNSRSDQKSARGEPARTGRRKVRSTAEIPAEIRRPGIQREFLPEILVSLLTPFERCTPTDTARLVSIDGQPIIPNSILLSL